MTGGWALDLKTNDRLKRIWRNQHEALEIESFERMFINGVLTEALIKHGHFYGGTETAKPGKDGYFFLALGTRCKGYFWKLHDDTTV